MLRRRGMAIGTVATLLLGACAHLGGGGGEGSAPPRADSVTVALYHFDEAGGTACADDGPQRLAAVAGLDTHTDFGRFGSARTFTASAESWIYAPYAPAMDTPHLSVETWIDLEALTDAEDTPIASRWSEYPHEQSWLFSVVGLRRETRLGNPALPGFHETLVAGGSPGRLMFAFQPGEPTPTQTFFSASEITLHTWNHVAVAYDGEVVRFYINGRLDAQYAVRATVRASTAALLIGNYFDTRRLTAFGGDLRLGSDLGYPPVYALRGAIDELRISSEARPPESR